MRSRSPALYVLVAALSLPVLRLAFRTRSRGVENVPRDGGAVVAANHLSNFDPWPLALALFPRRHLRFMAKIELFKPPLGWLLRGLGAFPVDRSRPDRDALARAIDLCRDGHAVMMFPEGTRRAKGRRKRFEAEPHTGAARIALRAGVPLVPCAVKGTDRLSRLGPLRVAFGRPIPVDDLVAADRRTAATVATDRLMEEIARLEQTL